MKICYFGTYEKDYHRNKVFIDGLRKKSIEITEIHEPLWEKIRHKTIKKILINLPKIFFTYKKLAWRALKSKKDFDYIIVGYPPAIDIFMAKLIFKKKILYNPLVSLYDTLVEDRKYVKGVFSKIIKIMDKLSYKYSDIVFFDTKTHADYLTKLYPEIKSKIKVIYLGLDTDIIFKKKYEKKKNKEFLVYFHGNFIPLHGIEKIILAAKLLEKDKDIKFLIIGTGQVEEKINKIMREKNIKNIERIKTWVPYKKLKDYVAKADVCLGVFGSSNKAKIVIPTKIYDYIACGKPVITMDSSASREIFKNRKNTILCENNPEDIAKSILLLKKNKKLRNNIAKEGYKLFKENFTKEKIGGKILSVLK